MSTATATATDTATATSRLVTPQGRMMVTMDRITRKVMIWLTNRGISILDSRMLAVRGRKSGEWRTTPVNLLTLDGERYLVAPRGHTQWVRNMRAAGGGELRLGRKAEAFTAVELADADKPVVLRHYLKRWAWEVGYFFDGITADSPEEELERIAPGFPVFRVTAA